MATVRTYPCPNCFTTLKGMYGMLVAIKDMLAVEREELLSYNPDAELPRVVEFGGLDDFMEKVPLHNHYCTLRGMQEVRSRHEDVIREYGHIWTHEITIRLRGLLYLRMNQILRSAFEGPEARLREVSDALRQAEAAQEGAKLFRKMMQGGSPLMGPLPFPFPPPSSEEDDGDDAWRG